MSGAERPPLIVPTGHGLYCPAGDFHIDPARPVPLAVITHAHGDHLRGGSARYVLAAAGERVARLRLAQPPQELRTLAYGEPLQLGSVRLSLHPAGHILGSAQVRIEHDGEVWVVSGDYKRAADPTCAPFEPLACDVFVSEATFALPVYRWPSGAQVAEEIARWWRGNRERGIASVLFCYALGKAQRVLAELRAHASEPVFVHGALLDPIAAYRDSGIEMLPTMPATTEHRRSFPGALIVAPPSAAGNSWMRRFGEVSTGFCSGWMRIRGDRRRRGCDRGFVLSDHADWPALLQTIAGTGARRVLLTHGRTDTLVRYLAELGGRAATLAPGRGAAA